MQSGKPKWQGKPLAGGDDWQPDSRTVATICDDYDIHDQQGLSTEIKKWRHSFLDQKHILKRPRDNDIRKRLGKIIGQADELKRSLTEFAEIEESRELDDQILAV